MLLSRFILYFPKNKKFKKSIDNCLILDYNVDTEKGREEKKMFDYVIECLFTIVQYFGAFAFLYWLVDQERKNEE